MKALTVCQPWAWAIIRGGKRIENRTQNWTYRGPLAIHAGRRWSKRGAKSTLVRNAWARTHGIDPGPHDYYSEPLPEWCLSGIYTGAIIGTVELVDAHPDTGCCRPWGESAYTEHRPNGDRERRDVIHLVLENPRPLYDPLPCRGALGLWTPPADIIRRLT